MRSQFSDGACRSPDIFPFFATRYDSCSAPSEVKIRLIYFLLPYNFPEQRDEIMILPICSVPNLGESSHKFTGGEGNCRVIKNSISAQHDHSFLGALTEGFRPPPKKNRQTRRGVEKVVTNCPQMEWFPSLFPPRTASYDLNQAHCFLNCTKRFFSSSFSFPSLFGSQAGKANWASAADGVSPSSFPLFCLACLGKPTPPLVWPARPLRSLTFSTPSSPLLN